MKTAKRIMLMLSITALLCCLLSVAAFAAGWGRRILTIGKQGNLNGRLRPFCLHAWSLR